MHIFNLFYIKFETAEACTKNNLTLKTVMKWYKNWKSNLIIKLYQMNTIQIILT